MLITPEEALEIVLSNVRLLKARQVALGEALHCRLSEAIRGDRDQPPTDRSSMDGYAVRTADLRKVPARLRLVAEVASGSAVRVRVRPEQIRDANGPALLAALAAQGIGNAVRTLVGDDPGAVASRLRLAARTHDVVLITGGVSVGRYDFVPEAI
jgi:molybdopterin molybdotransferase